jgi:hypothetical protein
MDLNDCLECNMCRAYVYDTIKRPLSIGDGVVFGPLINTKRAMRRAMVFIPEFVRATFDDSNHEHLAILFVESGGVCLSRCFNQQSVLPIARMWVRNRLKEIGDLDQLHYFHACASPPPDAIVAPNSAHGLRIRIPPPTYDDLYD